MKTKKTKKPPKTYLLAIRVFDEKFKEYKHEVFSFRSEKQREGMIKVCNENNVEWMKTV